MRDLKKSMQKDKKGHPKDGEMNSKMQAQPKELDGEPPEAKDASGQELASDDEPSDPEMDSNVDDEDEQEQEQKKREKGGSSDDEDLFDKAFQQQPKQQKNTQEDNRFASLGSELQASLGDFEEAVLRSIPQDSLCSDCNAFEGCVCNLSYQSSTCC